MSAFIVKDSTINKVVTFISIDRDNWYKHYLTELGYDMDKHFSKEKLAKDMFFLNCESVDARYKEGAAEEFRKLDFRYLVDINVNPITALKNLSCWLYQCTEGDIDKNPLYLAMQKIEGCIAKNIVRNLREYDMAERG